MLTFSFTFSALAWLAGVVSLNDLRLSPNLPGENFKTAVASDGKSQISGKYFMSSQQIVSLHITLYVFCLLLVASHEVVWPLS